MGKITKALHRKFETALKQKVIAFSAVADAARREDTSEGFQELVRNGRDPLHAVYTTTVNLVSSFLESTMDLAPLRPAVKFISDAEDLYAPGYPPMSPITVTLFVTWTLFDVPFGPDLETVGDCFAGLSDVLQVGEIREQATTHLRQSRLGIYEVIGLGGTFFRLRELVTNTELDALIPTGFQGRAGELILVRLVPPLRGETRYHVALTTPYLLLGFTETDWLEYFARHQILPRTVGVTERLHRHLKFGRTPDYWTEYIFYGYVNHRSDAIFLTGLPDRPDTQPHHETYDPRTDRIRLLNPRSLLG